MKSGERFTTVDLDANSEEYKRVEQSARATSQNSLNHIVKVLSSLLNCDMLPFLVVLIYSIQPM